MLDYSEIRQRKIIIYEGEPAEVLDYHIARTQQRKPQNQVKLKSLLSGRTWNATFHVSDKAEEADVSKRDIKHLYNNKGEFWFCDPEDPKDRFSISTDVIGEATKYLKANENVTAMIWQKDGEDKIIKIILPIKMEFLVKEAPPSIRGNTANGGGKLVTLENDIKINVPFFVEQGDRIVLNTETGEYTERVQK